MISTLVKIIPIKDNVLMPEKVLILSVDCSDLDFNNFNVVLIENISINFISLLIFLSIFIKSRIEHMTKSKTKIDKILMTMIV